MAPNTNGTNDPSSWESRIREILQRFEDGNRSAMARRIGVTRQAVSSWTRGETSPSGDALARMLRSYPELDARWLLTGEEQLEGTGEPAQS